MGPLVSVIIPTYNRAPDLDRALKSLLAQTYRFWEAIVIDNHSTDDTDSLIASINDPRIKLFKVHNEGVIALSRNVGIKQSKGEYVAFLDSDDWWVPGKLEEVINRFIVGADVVYHDLSLATKSSQKILIKRTNTRTLKSPVFNDLIMHGNALATSSAVVRRSLLEKVGGFSEERQLIAAEDYDAWLRIASVSESFVRIPKVLGFYWLGGGNLSSFERTLALTQVIEKRYANEIAKRNLQKRIYIFDYIRGRIYYQLRLYEDAKKNLGRVQLKTAPINVYFKSRFMLMIIHLLHRKW